MADAKRSCKTAARPATHVQQYLRTPLAYALPPMAEFGTIDKVSRVRKGPQVRTVYHFKVPYVLYLQERSKVSSADVSLLYAD
jgi:hypothetical protein